MSKQTLIIFIAYHATNLFFNSTMCVHAIIEASFVIFILRHFLINSVAHSSIVMAILKNSGKIPFAYLDCHMPIKKLSYASEMNNLTLKSDNFFIYAHITSSMMCISLIQ